MMDLTSLAYAALGGVLIGLAASMLWLFNGRVAGISGIAGDVLLRKSEASEVPWRGAFIAGLLVGGLALSLLTPDLFLVTHGRTLPLLAVGGVLVGFGVRLGSGCTSGHGVCGVSRFSPRSIVATLTFITTGALTVLLTRLLAGAA